MYRQSIITKYLGATNSRGSRVKASAPAGSITVPWDYGANADEMHVRAARALIDKLGWDGTWAAGGNADHSGFVFVWLGDVVPESLTIFKLDCRKART
ncbi:MAG: hypothetical protein ACOVN5_06925 [Aquidulcibacter sp.]